mmetsp:Transcript_6232/g.8043  ORF Transcript_6232/g.8043 Transcript_6232/m.8043 type:complete len:307 (+) Transcript_6232:75-995(+)|eukprot:CAMPEP_0114360566 /NCGR_PEP_ID=MMETSP0101-20121206/23959_1 /TAXON_ID=38822 ORGANISM="Pteridomonas danica, Strain PT" /NCGR_SAMPLE_ID=MMETSP0101 /ASSEMBLY_ACC=CAM_ASM_000211 /LENGTH=306 /DNA_ID=CAMNT_0001504865 /DNA_START=8 /DNA_END=928 /DNA_ORIENTATION=-
MSEPATAPSAAYVAAMHFIGGTLGGMTGVAASYPLDTVKVRMQTQEMTGTYYKGMGDCVSTVWRTEGIGAFYRGIAAPMSSYGLIKSITFGSYGNTLDVFKKKHIAAGTWAGTHTMFELFVAGCIGGFACTGVMAPNDRIKVQMQLSASEGRPFKGVIDCGKYIVAENGIFTKKGLFRGWTATAARDVPGMSGYYVAYEAIKKVWTPWGKDGKHSDMQNLTAGGLSGQLSWLPVYPMDVIKSRIQARSGTANAYKSIGDAATQMLKKEGPFVFYKGFAPTLIQAFPLHGSVFMVYELWCRFTGLKK